MTEQLVQITVDGKAIHVAPGNTVIQALALSGEPLLEHVGCMGQGVCGSCRCMVRRLGSRDVKTELACADREPASGSVPCGGLRTCPVWGSVGTAPPAAAPHP